MSSSTFSPHANSTLSDTINDTYVTAIEDSPSRYLSVLESTNEEAISLDNLNDMTVAVEHMNVDEDHEIVEQQQQQEEEHLVCSDDAGDMTLMDSAEEVNNGQIVVFTLEGSDDYYGVQVAQDEDGNFHRYQFQFRKSDDGQLEAIPESIQLLPDEDDQSPQQQQIVENSTDEDDDVQNIIEVQQQQQQQQRPHQQYDDGFHAAVIHETEMHLPLEGKIETEVEEDQEDESIEQKVLAHQQHQLQTASSGLRIYIGQDQQHSEERILPDDDDVEDDDRQIYDVDENAASADLEEDESQQNSEQFFDGGEYVVETEEQQQQQIEQQPNPKAEICEEQEEEEADDNAAAAAAAETNIDVKPTDFMHMKQELIDENTSEEFARERASFVAHEQNHILNEAPTSDVSHHHHHHDDGRYQDEALAENDDVIGLAQPQELQQQYIRYEQQELQQDGAADTEEEEEGEQDEDEVYEELNDSEADQEQEDGCLGELDDRGGNFIDVQPEQQQQQPNEQFIFDINMEINEPICEIASSEDNNAQSSNNSDRDLGHLQHLTIDSNSSGGDGGVGDEEEEEEDHIDDENSADIAEQNDEEEQQEEEEEEEMDEEVPETTQDFCQQGVLTHNIVAGDGDHFQFLHTTLLPATLETGNHADGGCLQDDQLSQVLGKGVFSAVTTDRLNNAMTTKKSLHNNQKEPIMMVGRTYLQQQQNNKLDDPKLLLYLVHPEKENVDALSFSSGNNNNNTTNAVYGKPLKANPRSILRSSHLSGAGSVVQQMPQQQQQQQQQPKLQPQAQKHPKNIIKKPILLQDLTVASSYQEKLAAKRFARGKEATQARILQNFINKTTIPQAPVRTNRLPRKQKIKPVERLGGEEIVVQEVMVSSEGFVEAVCTSGGGRMNKRAKQRVTDYVELTDSDEDGEEEYLPTSKRSKKQDTTKTITISDTEDETTRDSVIDLEAPDTTASESSPPTDGTTSGATNVERSGTKRRRGRPPKKSTNGKKASTTGASQLMISPVEDSGMGSEDTASSSMFAKTEIPCTVCSKTFASANSLKTHLQHHNLENSMKNASNTTNSTLVDKYKCDQCSEAFKNSVLLKRHLCPSSSEKSNSVDNGMVKCPVCKKSFPNTTTLNVHKRLHVKELLAKQTLAHMTPPKNKKIAQQTPKSPTATTSKTTAQTATTASGMIKCSMCKKTFPNMTTLSVHKRVHAKEQLAKQTLLAQTATPPKHRKSQQPPPQNLATPSAASSSTSCSSGQSVFKLPAVKKKTVASVAGTSVFRCNVCRKICPSQQTLTAHQKIHKDLTCPTCAKCFSNRLILAQHVRNASCCGNSSSSVVKSPKSSSKSPTSNKSKRRSPRSKSSSCLTDVGGDHDAGNNPETNSSNTTRASTSFVRSRTSMSLPNSLNCDVCSMQFSSKVALKSHKLVKHPDDVTDGSSVAGTPSKSIGNSASKRTSTVRRQHCGIPATAKFARAFQGIRELNFDDDDDDDK